jgi:hypothetical protein
MDEFLKVFLPTITGLIAGAIGSLFAPWANWGIEKQKSRLANRKKLIADTRKILKSPPKKEVFRDSTVYSQLRPFLSDATQKIIEGDAIYVNLAGRGSGVNNYKVPVLDELNLLEKKMETLIVFENPCG